MLSALAWLGAALLAAVFAWAAAAKFARFKAWREALAGYGFSGAAEIAAAPLVPLVEAATVLLIALLSVKAGAALALALLGGFSFAVLRARAQRGDRIPCGCFGRTKERDYRLILGRNLLLVAVAATVLSSKEEEGLLSGMEVPPAGEILPALLAGLGVSIVIVVLWQTGRIMSGSPDTARVKR